jgi:hypothetical protein
LVVYRGDEHSSLRHRNEFGKNLLSKAGKDVTITSAKVHAAFNELKEDGRQVRALNLTDTPPPHMLSRNGNMPLFGGGLTSRRKRKPRPRYSNAGQV